LAAARDGARPHMRPSPLEVRRGAVAAGRRRSPAARCGAVEAVGQPRPQLLRTGHGRREVTNGALHVVEHEDLTNSDVLERDVSACWGSRSSRAPRTAASTLAPWNNRRGALAPHEPHLPVSVRRVKRRHAGGRCETCSTRTYVEAAARGRDMLRLPEHWVVGREAEDGRTRRGDAPRHHDGETLQAVVSCSVAHVVEEAEAELARAAFHNMSIFSSHKKKPCPFFLFLSLLQRRVYVSF
jgi:hypothetical protein